MAEVVRLAPEKRYPWRPWRDEYGNEHAEIPRCEAYTKPKGRNPWDERGHQCPRRGARRRVDAPGWKGEHWFCEQHDPERPSTEGLQGQVRELRAALAAVLPAARYALRAAAPGGEAVSKARDWRRAVRRGEDLVEGGSGSG